MIDLVRKRHEGDGWQVFSELANGTGWKVKGWADAAALGIWPSRGHEFHGYEFKISREDLKKELRDPSKADNVGKYCDFWWLVVSSEQLLEGLVIPETWGILTPRGKVLRVVRKAPKLDAKPFDRAFCAAMIRNVIKTWVPKHVHEALKNNARDKARAELEAERCNRALGAEHDLQRLKAVITRFEEESGVKVDAADWYAGNIGKAVRAVLDARSESSSSMRDPSAEVDDIVRREAETLERAAARHDMAAGNARLAAERVRSILEREQPSVPDV